MSRNYDTLYVARMTLETQKNDLRLQIFCSYVVYLIFVYIYILHWHIYRVL
jgi:hypothetical protein